MSTLSEKLALAFADAIVRSSEAERPRILRGFLVLLKRRQLLFRAHEILAALEEHFASRDRPEMYHAQAASPVRLPNAKLVIRKDLIAGVRFTKDGYVIDASVKRRLNQLRQSLNPHF